MTRSVLLGDLKEALITHLVEVEEQSASFIEEFFPPSSPDREQSQAMVKEYISKLEALVQRAHLITDQGSFPLVIIGSRVEVEDLTAKGKVVFQIISPNGELPGENGISPLSPVGSALFLKSIGDEVMVEAPGGTFHYQITAIDYLIDTENNR
ncbi:MAG TPA: transcription elongation factor GreAB [Firmicutes bacterium]|jgi:transcription elongation GreA/GreB family factor|nr:transcription elongation factor GreAB [Bacillota bacterium]HBR28450.1 transcription elongation factor GreAB [Bacillota bacterium]HBR34056.1 transcription elongation factor GreAB [Bacillota bacterium]